MSSNFLPYCELCDKWYTEEDFEDLVETMGSSDRCPRCELHLDWRPSNERPINSKEEK